MISWVFTRIAHSHDLNTQKQQRKMQLSHKCHSARCLGTPRQHSSPSRSEEVEPCRRRRLSQRHCPSVTGWARSWSWKGSYRTNAGSNESWQTEHRIIEQLGLKGTFKGPLVQSPARSEDIFNQFRLQAKHTLVWLSQLHHRNTGCIKNRWLCS